MPAVVDGVAVFEGWTAGAGFGLAVGAAGVAVVGSGVVAAAVVDDGVGVAAGKGTTGEVAGDEGAGVERAG